MKHLTERWAGLQKQALTPRTWWHVTDNPALVLDATHRPAGDGGYTHDAGRLFVTPNPELWLYLWRYHPGRKMYAAEIKCATPPRSLGMVGGDDRDQATVPVTDAEVVRVVPVEQAIREARKDGFGFAMLMADAYEPSLIHVLNHKKGWGSVEALCGGYGTGTPLKWTTKNWVLTGPMADRVCPDCMGKLRRQRT